MVSQDFCLIVEFHLFQMSLCVFTSILNSPCGCESIALLWEHSPRGPRLLWAGCSQTWLKQCGLSSQRQYISLFIYWHPAAWHPSTTTTVTGWACHQNALMIKGKRWPGDWKKTLFHWRQLRITHYSFCSLKSVEFWKAGSVTDRKICLRSQAQKCLLEKEIFSDSLSQLHRDICYVRSGE